MALLAIDIGGSAVKYALYSDQELKNKDEFPTPLTRGSFYEEIQKIITEFSKEEEITGIGLSCPGDVDEETGQVNSLSFVPFLHLGEFQQEFSEAVSLPVSMINDANSAALAEMTLGIGKGHKQALFVIIGTGIGLAIVKDGEVVLDEQETKEEVDQYVAGGIKDVNNSFVSPVSIARRVSLKKFQLPSTYNGEDVFKLADEGDKIASKEIERMYQSLADVVISLNLAYQPELIGIGGGISNNSDLVPHLNETIKAKLADESYLVSLFKSLFDKEVSPSKAPNLEVCEYKNDANLLGAVIHYQNRNK